MNSESMQDALQRAHEEGYKEGFAAGWQQAREFPETTLDLRAVALREIANSPEMAATKARMDKVVYDGLVAQKQQVVSS